jgi:hypothetical protein
MGYVHKYEIKMEPITVCLLQYTSNFWLIQLINSSYLIKPSGNRIALGILNTHSEF